VHHVDSTVYGLEAGIVIISMPKGVAALSIGTAAALRKPNL
jgi:hypothetical protein